MLSWALAVVWLVANAAIAFAYVSISRHMSRDLETGPRAELAWRHYDGYKRFILSCGIGHALMAPLYIPAAFAGHPAWLWAVKLVVAAQHSYTAAISLRTERLVARRVGAGMSPLPESPAIVRALDMLKETRDRLSATGAAP